MKFALPRLNLPRSCVFLSALLAIFPTMLRAQTATNPPVTENRWLLIVETSRGMQKRAAAAQQIAASLVFSGMRGQMRPDDTLGVWTFNNSLYTGRYPLQSWTPQDKQEIARDVLEFLKSQKNEKTGSLSSISIQLLDVVKSSRYITVIVISDGASPILGTPFDAKINASYKEWQTQQKKSLMPFLTVLRAKAGKFTDYIVSTPPFQLELPPLPEELLVKPKAVEVKSEPSKPVATLPPLILSGRKSEPENLPVVAETNTVVAPVAVIEPAKTVPLVSQESQPAIKPESKETPVTIAETNLVPTTMAMEVSNQVAVMIPVEAAPKRIHIGMILAAVVGAIAIIGFFLMRRSRNSAGVSLITRSLDHDRK